MPNKGSGPPAGTLVSRIECLERDMIIDALKRSAGNISASARELGITPRMVRYKIGKLGIDSKVLFQNV
jgi:Nif-specific regulatory protein